MKQISLLECLQHQFAKPGRKAILQASSVTRGRPVRKGSLPSTSIEGKMNEHTSGETYALLIRHTVSSSSPMVLNAVYGASPLGLETKLKDLCAAKLEENSPNANTCNVRVRSESSIYNTVLHAFFTNFGNQLIATFLVPSARIYTWPRNGSINIWFHHEVRLDLRKQDIK